MTRLALAVVVATAGITASVTHHHRRPAVASEQRPESLRTSRAQERQPLAPVNAHLTGEGATPTHRRTPVRRVGPSRPAGASGLSDVTMYCATGNRNAAGRWPRLGDVAVFDRSIRSGTRLLIAGRRYIVEDWIGSGSQFDIFGGDDDGCEQRALTFGRQRLVVQVIR